MRDERSACHYGVSVPPRYKAVPFRGRYAPRKCLTAPFATRNLEQAIWSQIWSRLYTEYRTHTHGYTRTRGARRRSHRTHARAATGQTAIGQAPDSRAPQRRASTSHASAASVKRHTAQTQAQLCTPLSPCHPARTKRPERRPHVSLGIVAPCVCPPKQRIHPSSFHVNARTDPDHTGVNSPQLSCTDGSEKDMHNGRKCSRPAQSTRAKEAAARGAAARLLSIGATLRASDV